MSRSTTPWAEAGTIWRGLNPQAREPLWALPDRTQFRRAAQPQQRGALAVKQINADVGVNWLFSFLSADKKKTYCLYEATSADLIREAA